MRGNRFKPRTMHLINFWYPRITQCNPMKNQKLRCRSMSKFSILRDICSKNHNLFGYQFAKPRPVYQKYKWENKIQICFHSTCFETKIDNIDHSRFFNCFKRFVLTVQQMPNSHRILKGNKFFFCSLFYYNNIHRIWSIQSDKRISTTIQIPNYYRKWGSRLFQVFFFFCFALARALQLYFN